MWHTASSNPTFSTSCTSVPTERPPTVLDGLIQPDLPVKVYTLFFLKDRLVATKTGSWTTYAAGTMSSAMGGSAASRSQGCAIGTLMDHFGSNSRGNKAEKLAGYGPDEMVAADKANFQVPYSFVTSVEIKRPNFANELHVKIKAGKDHKFRMDNQSKGSIKYVLDIFQELLPGKVALK